AIKGLGSCYQFGRRARVQAASVDNGDSLLSHSVSSTGDGEFPMPHLDIVDTLAEMLLQLFTQIHRAVLSARATNGNGYIAAVIGLIVGPPALEELLNIGEHVLNQLFPFEKGNHRRILATERAQFGMPMRIGQ